MIFLSKKKPQNSITQKGFSLFEMIVAIAIFTILTTILLAKNSQFQGNILVTNFSYQLALDIRQAQVYGINVHGFSSLGTSAYANGYGIHFGQAPILPVPGNSFILFNDIDGNGKYNSNPSSIVTIFTLPQSSTNEIIKYCVSTVRYGKDAYCGPVRGGNGIINTLDIAFRRPDPAAIISVDDSYGAASTISGTGDAITSATIYVASIKGGPSKGVEVEANGQIFVQ